MPGMPEPIVVVGLGLLVVVVDLGGNHRVQPAATSVTAAPNATPRM